jgi:hypothetical protein
LALAVAGLFSTRTNNVGLKLFCLTQWCIPLIGLRLAELILGRALTQTRYLIFISPFLYLWLALTAASLGRRLSIVIRAMLMIVVATGTLGYFASTRYADPHLAALKGQICLDTDKRTPVLYLDPFYYLPMRHYYLPERPHFLVGERTAVANWDEMPGYKPYLANRNLAALKRCLVVDPRHQMFPGRLGIASGRQVLAFLASRH